MRYTNREYTNALDVQENYVNDLLDENKRLYDEIMELRCEIEKLQDKLEG